MAACCVTFGSYAYESDECFVYKEDVGAWFSGFGEMVYGKIAFLIPADVLEGELLEIYCKNVSIKEVRKV